MSTRRVDSSTSGPLMRMPSCAPRPVPTMSAVGVARPSAHGQAMIRTATAAVNAAGSPAPVPSQKPRVATASASTTGTKTPEIRSASRCTSALPFCASSTSRAIWASWVSAPTRVARTTSRPPALTVAPATASPGRDLDRHGLAGQHRGVDGRGALDDRRRRWRSSRRGGRRSGRRRPARRPGCARSTPPRRTGDLLGAELQQRPQRGAGLALGAGLEVAAGEDERGDPGGGLEVDVRGAVGAGDGQLEGVRHAGLAGGAEEQRAQRPAEGGERAERDQGVHGRGAVPQVGPGGPVERPAAPDDDRRGEGQREPLPVRRTAAPGPSPARRRARRAPARRAAAAQERRLAVRLGASALAACPGAAARGALGGVAGLLDGGDQVVGRRRRRGSVTFAFSVA